MKLLSFKKILTLLLALFFLLSFSLPTFALDPNRTLGLKKQLDEHPNPDVAGHPRYFVILTYGNSFLTAPIFIKSVRLLKAPVTKQSLSPRENGNVQ